MKWIMIRRDFETYEVAQAIRKAEIKPLYRTKVWPYKDKFRIYMAFENDRQHPRYDKEEFQKLRQEVMEQRMKEQMNKVEEKKPIEKKEID